MRIKKFYAYFDNHNNDRVYQVIKEMDNPKKNFIFNDLNINYGLLIMIIFFASIKIFLLGNYKIKEIIYFYK